MILEEAIQSVFSGISEARISVMLELKHGEKIQHFSPGPLALMVQMH